MLLKLVCSVYCDADCGQSSIFQKEAFASAVGSRCFYELCMSGTIVRNLVFGLLAHSPTSRAQGTNVQKCLTWITVEVFLPTHLKRTCNWAAGLHVRWCPSGVNAETETGSESTPIFPLLRHPTTTTSFQQMQNTCVMISKRKSLCYLLADFTQLFL